VPSLVTIPVGVGAFLGAFASRLNSTPAENQHLQTTTARSLLGVETGAEPVVAAMPSHGPALRLAWRIAWRTFVFSTLFSGVGYVLMLACWACMEIIK
jgi:hypothetical protein